MYLTMYNESVQKISNQDKIIVELKEQVRFLTVEMELYKTKMREELLRLQIKLGKKNENKKIRGGPERPPGGQESLLGNLSEIF